MTNLLRHSILFLILTLIFISCKEGDFNDASKRNENWAYWIDKDSGKASWIPITDETTVENGVYHLFYNNGKLFEKGKLKNKVHVDTVYRYNEQGEVIKYHIHQKDTILYVYLKDGDYLEKYHSGKTFEKGKLTNGVFNDDWVRYYENGQPEWIQEYVNGNGLVTWFFENGNISSKSYRVNRKPHGEVKHWYENGNLKEVSNWKNGIQENLSAFFYENGQVQSKSNFKNGNFYGKSEYWYENGQLKILSFYIDDVLDGPYKQWKENGKLEVDGAYNNNLLSGMVLKYHSNGSVAVKGFVKNSYTPFGIWKDYNEQGNLTKKRYFENGNLIKEEKF